MDVEGGEGFCFMRCLEFYEDFAVEFFSVVGIYVNS